MSRAVERQLGRIERAIGLVEGEVDADHGERPGQEWVAPERAQHLQMLLLRLYATHVPKPYWFDGRRAELEHSHPSAGYWCKKDPDGELRVGELCDGLLSRMRASSIILQQLAADPARCARMDAEGIARLRRYLQPTDVLQPLLERLQAETPAVEAVDDLARLQLRPGEEIVLRPPDYGIVDPGADPDEEGRG